MLLTNLFRMMAAMMGEQSQNATTTRRKVYRQSKSARPRGAVRLDSFDDGNQLLANPGTFGAMLDRYADYEPASGDGQAEIASAPQQVNVGTVNVDYADVLKT